VKLALSSFPRYVKLVVKLRDELLAELEDSHQLSYEEPRVKLANIACSEVRYLAS